LAVSTAVEQLVATCTGKRKEKTKQSEEKQTRVLLSHPVFSQDPQASIPVNSKVPPPSIEPKQPASHPQYQRANFLKR
jgi:hypothetical protein